MRVGLASSVVHIENSYASGHKKRPRGPRPTPASNPINLETQAITYYMQYHLQTLKDSPDVLKSFTDDFLPIWMSNAEYPMLHLAVTSMALAVFSRTQQHPQAAIEASLAYHRLLQIAQATILSLDKGNVDACLLAIFFMSRYEEVVHRPNHLVPGTRFATSLHSFSHHDGALAILRTWKDDLSHSHSATDIIKHTRRGMIRSALLRNLALPEWLLQGTSFGERGLELRYDAIILRIASVRQCLSLLLKEMSNPQCASHDFTSTAEELNKQTRDTDKELQEWTTHFPRTWYSQHHTLPNLPSDFYSPTIYSYSSPAYAAVWSHYYAMRMLINSARLRVLAFCHGEAGDFPHEQRLECLSHMQIMANDLASSVPFCLQRFKITPTRQESIVLNTGEDIKPYMANLTIWPLSIASSLRDVEVTQKEWFRSMLARLGRTVGAGIFEYAETDQWFDL